MKSVLKIYENGYLINTYRFETKKKAQQAMRALRNQYTPRQRVAIKWNARIERDVSFEDKIIEVQRAGYPDDTIKMTVKEWVGLLDVSDGYAKRLIDERMEDMIVRRIAHQRCAGCNYRLTPHKIGNGKYILR